MIVWGSKAIIMDIWEVAVRQLDDPWAFEDT